MEVLMYFIVYQDTARGWRWTLYAENNRKIADSGEAYERKEGAYWGIGLVKGTDANTPIRER
jgi:uncharacterized protein YegP (UPF0339 family)